jgi:hypothetical protein
MRSGRSPLVGIRERKLVSLGGEFVFGIPNGSGIQRKEFNSSRLKDTISSRVLLRKKSLHPPKVLIVSGHPLTQIGTPCSLRGESLLVDPLADPHDHWRMNAK